MNVYKLIVILLFVFVVYNLAQALRHMFNTDKDRSKMAKALTWRIGLSLATFILIVILIGMGKLGINPSPIQIKS